jgi:hypothetical protein
VEARKLDYWKFKSNIIDTSLFDKYNIAGKIDTNFINNSCRDLNINLDNKLSLEYIQILSPVLP